METLTKNKLSIKLYANLFIPALAGFLLLSIIFYAIGYRVEFNNAKQNLIITSKTLSKSIYKVVKRGETENVNKILKAVTKNNEMKISNVLILYKSGKIIQEYKSNSLEQYDLKKLTHDIVNAGKVTQTTFRPEGSHIIVTSPISSLEHESNIGTIIIVESLEFMHKKLDTITFISTIALFLVMSSMFIIITINLNRVIIEPLQSATKQIDSFISNPSFLKALDTKEENEIGIMMRSFYNLASKITKRDKSLRYSNQQLEREISERTQLETHLRLAKEDAEKASELKSEFLANISHELRTPIHAILGFSELMINKHDRMTKEKSINNLSRIRNNGEQLLVLINNLLDLSKLETHSMELDFAKTNLVEIINTAISNLGSLLNNKELTIIFVKNYDALDAEFDKNAIKSVVINLITNAIKFSPEKKSIKITLEKIEYNGKNSAKFTISDKGRGIPHEELKSIFNKFIQSSKTKTGAGGTGLGLAICKEYIGQHKGTIYARSNEKGAQFIFIIPVTQIEEIKL